MGRESKLEFVTICSQATVDKLRGGPGRSGRRGSLRARPEGGRLSRDHAVELHHIRSRQYQTVGRTIPSPPSSSTREARRVRDNAPYREGIVPAQYLVRRRICRKQATAS